MNKFKKYLLPVAAVLIILAVVLGGLWGCAPDASIDSQTESVSPDNGAESELIGEPAPSYTDPSFNPNLPRGAPSLGEVFDPSGNPFAHRFSDVTDLRTATFVVAASDSEHRYEADYTCDGVADDVEINEALTVAGAGGRVILLEGTYTLADPIAFTNNNQVLEGQGRGTFIDGDGLATDEHAVTIPSKNNCVIRNLAIQTEDGGTKTCHCIYARGNDIVIDGVIIVDSDDIGIYLHTSASGMICNCLIEDTDGDNICINTSASPGVIIMGNMIEGAGGMGINVTNSGQYLQIYNNIIRTSTGTGIYVSSASYSVIQGNSIYSPDVCGIDLNTPAYTTVCSNTIRTCGSHCISIDGGSHDVVVASNDLNDGDHGIHIDGGADMLISGNYSNSHTQDGICLNNCKDTSVVSNLCLDNGASGICLLASTDDCFIDANYCFDNGTYGIEIAAVTCDRNTVTNNKLRGNTTNQFLNSGTNTILATYVVPFSDGSDSQDSGYEIDTVDEYARAWLRLPDEVQQVVWIRVYARSVVTETHEMELQMVVEGGADNEPYTTHTGSVAQLDSVSVNFAANDIIYWQNTEAGTLALLGGDSVEVKVIHEALEEDNCATDAFFRTVEIGYM